MKRSTMFAAMMLCCLAAFALAADGPKRESLEEMKAAFKNPPRDYTSGPLWTWNDLLTEEQIRSTMQDMAAQHVKQVWVHPRPGLMTPYLSDDWFRLWGVALDEAQKLDMNVWIYDENSYPSGFAGGFVPEALPDSRGQGLHAQRTKKLDNIDGDTLFVFEVTRDAKGNETFTNRTDILTKLGELPQDGDWLVFRRAWAGSSGWFGGWWYVDLLKKGVTEKFIEITFEAYRKHFGDEFGQHILGIFTDEPHLQTAGGLTWNEEIPVLFEKTFGYSLIENLPSMTNEVGDWKRVRHDYQKLLLDLFIERWAKPCFEYCEKNNLEFTGHYWEHGWPGAGHGPDNMAMYAWHQRPAIDILMNQYDEGVNAQFGNARAVKELSSVANQMGYKRTLSETYGAGGWDLRFADMKRIADWQYALGVNTTNEHLSYVTIRGARKRDHPQSFSYHASWWNDYHLLADYHARISYALTRGEQVNRVLVIEPTTTAWMYQGHPHLAKIGNDFQNFVHELERSQVEYDLGSEDIIARHGGVMSEKSSLDFSFSLKGLFSSEISIISDNMGKLTIGKRNYDLVILPKNMENISRTTLDLLGEFVAQGGIVVACETFPTRIDGVLAADEVKKYLGDVKTVSTEDARYIASEVSGTRGNEVATTNAGETSGKLFRHRRIVDGGEILFLCNTSMTENAAGEFLTVHEQVEEWDPFTGEIRPYTNFIRHSRVPGDETWPTAYHTAKLRVAYDLPPCGSLLLHFPAREIISVEQRTPRTLTTLAPPQIVRQEPNVLVLDYVDVKIGDEEKNGIYFYPANRWIFQKHGFGANPWDNGVQFRDTLITKTFPAESGFSATYRFTLGAEIKSPVTESLYVVIERPDIYTITCNGKTVTAKDGDWWLDKSFGKVAIGDAVRVGENEVTLTAKPMTIWHELESAYLIGDFSLTTTERGFTVYPAGPLGVVPDAKHAEKSHTTELEHVSWLSSGIGFAPESPLKDDRSPWIVFDLGNAAEPFTTIKIWNYCEANLSQRGIKEMNVYVSSSPDPKSDARTLLGTVTLRKNPRGGSQSFSLPFTGAPQKPHRYVVFEILSNHDDATYPVASDAKVNDNALVGLAEVQFFAAGGKQLAAKVAAASSELVVRSHDRKSAYIVDGSGLAVRERRGWHEQGMPFYAGGVAYTEKFSVPEIAASAKYEVQLGDWYGSVARVLVNGKSAGHIAFAPFALDVTQHIKQGENEITVVVVGTPKNLLGPHHNGSPRGTAWPGMFWNAPETQPDGNAYDTISYGLFEPFTLRECPIGARSVSE
ncbi:MAG: glycosyl hydrolase [Thermoguttaceae bacterium]